MDKLALQSTCFENIKTLCINFKKDSKSRKTKEYLDKRLSSLDAQWMDFNERHTLLLQEIEDKKINYFTEDVYSKTKTMYETTKADILKMLQATAENVKFDLTNLSGGEPDEKTKTLLTRQECNFKAIDRAMAKIDFEVISEKWELDDHLSILKSKWEAIDNTHWELEALLKGSEHTYYDMFNSMEAKYDAARKRLKSRMWSNAHHQQSAPRIEIPEFTGHYSKWISFKDLFLETIHKNPTLSKAQKMQHLKTRLKGEAERLVQHLSISADNYTSCWDILNQRYDNRRLQFSSYMNTMLQLPVIQKPDAYNLKKLHDVTTECLNGLTNIGFDITSWDPMIVHQMSQKLDSGTYNEYIKTLHDNREVPTLQEFLMYLENQFMAFETMKTSKKDIPSTEKSAEKSSRKNFDQKKWPKSYHTSYGKCPLCKDSHVLMRCQRFIDLDTKQRNSAVAKMRLCKNCLFSHENETCNSTKTCKECNMKHHTLLHYSNYNKNTPSTSNENQRSGQRPSRETETPSSNHLSATEMEVLLTTVQVKIKSIDGTYITLRALVDQGSQVNLITETAAQLLRLPRNKLTAKISGVGSVSGDCRGRVNLTCQSIHSEYTFNTEALIMKKLINKLPNNSFERPEQWSHLQNLKLADPDFNISRSVDILFGADVYAEIIQDGILKGTPKSPVAQQTQLGWTLCGKLETLNCYVTLLDLSEITKFWECEDIIKTKTDRSQEDQCETYYKETTRRGSDGRYIVKMPLHPNYENKIGTSKTIAVSQLLQLEKRFQRNGRLELLYKEFLREYLELGHMKLAKPVTSSTTECFLPHHGVLREESTTTKLRVVFNASQKTKTECSLNDVQEKGPNLQKDIQELIIKWRTYKFAFTADIEKMYRCIWLSEEQQNLQKIIWRTTPSEKLQEYQLCTVTYGTKCAPWLAMRTIKQLAYDEGYKYPTAAKVLLNEAYVDDVISGHNSLEAAQELQTSLIDMLKGAGMNLRKWSSNEPTLLQNLREDQISQRITFDFKQEESMKTLGLGWNPQADTFTFNWKFEEKCQPKITKRRLLSEISQLYDPLGWLSPITIAAKIIFQEVWVNNLDWDDQLPSDIAEKWLKLRTDIPNVKHIKIKRWISSTKQKIELFGFCDASERAYACVVYSCVRDEHNKPTITMLASKTRVAPIAQTITLPKLELCGALLLSQLIEKIREALDGYDITTSVWCDSQVVLAWLQGDTSKREKYIANRVAKILQIIPAEQWCYVKSQDNPADCASRGMLPTKLKTFSLWWEGPTFLTTIQLQSREENIICTFTTNLGSICQAKTESINKETNNIIHNLLTNCSLLTKAIRIVAWIQRFIGNARNKTKRDTGCLTLCELNNANEQIIKYVQQTEITQEYKQLMKKETISTKSNILKLKPYLDNNGLIRVGGRLNHSSLPFEMKNPIILPKGGRLTELVINQAHLTTLHGGARLTLAYIRQRYWIVGGNRAVKAELRRCVRCHRYKPSELNQLMGELPPQRVTPSRPFTHTGVDFTGHVEVKLNKGRGVRTSKGYICIFVCMVTKAVHIELASDLSTETFIAAFERMCSRRGRPGHVYSDCGTNFIGASRVLQKEFEDYKQILTPNFYNKITDMGVQWHFNAPAWPTAGGLWEAAVKSMKYHLRRVLGDQKLTYEEFTTLLAKIEACMNSRPLCQLTEDPEEFYNYLTPGHFLTGGPTMSLPRADYTEQNHIDLRRRWQLTEHMYQQFWKNWSSDYLTQLQTRSKWNNPKKNLNEGDVVLVRDNNLPPGKWAMGRVLELHPGADGYVRVTTIKTQNGVIKRPITKLSVLPIDTTCNKNYEECKTDLQKSKKTGKTTTKKYSGRKCLTNILMFLFTIFTLVNGSYGSQPRSGTHITNLEPERPIYYDNIGKIELIHAEWTLLTYYNLTNYWQGTQQIEKYIHGVNDLCQKIHQSYCQATMNQLTHEMELLNFYNAILLAPHTHLATRKKRGLIDGVGMVANSLFGILDQNFADKYHKDIDAVQRNENYLRELAKNQTSIMQLQNDALKKNDENIKLQCKMIEHFIEETKTNLGKIETEIQLMMATSYFNSASLTASLLLRNLKEFQTMLLNTLTNVYSGHMDVHLISPVSLVKQLEDISGRLPRTLSLPTENIREDIKELYKLLYVKARITKNYLMFEVHIPLIADEDFTYYRAIAIPFKAESNYKLMQLSSEYIAVNFEKNSYISLKNEDFRQCIKRQKHNFICHANIPVFNLQNKNAPCEAKLLGHRTTTSPCDVRSVSCEEAWIKLQESNSWLVVCCGRCELRTVCENDVISQTITSMAIVTLRQGCVLRSKEVTITAHNQYNSNLNVNYDIQVPNLKSPINNIVNVTLHNSPKELFTLKKNDFTEIDKKLRFQQENEPKLPSTISDHDVHQYAICYFLLTIAVITFLWIITRKYCTQLRKSFPTKKQREQMHEDIELQPMGSRQQTARDENQQAPTDDCHGQPQGHRHNIAFTFD